MECFILFFILNSFWGPPLVSGSFLGGSGVKNPPAKQEAQEMQVPSLDWKDPLEEETEAHSRILAWKILWTEEPAAHWITKSLNMT